MLIWGTVRRWCFSEIDKGECLMHSAQKRRIGQISIDVFKLIGVVFLFAILVQTVANVTGSSQSSV